jgi:GWxTD domain-containing protein
MNKILKKLSGLLFLSMVILTGCQTSSKVSLNNISFLYKKEKQFTELDCWVYHATDSTSTLFVKVYFNDLVYFKDSFSGLYTSSYRLSYKLSEGYESKESIQAYSILGGDSINYGKNGNIVHSFDLNARYPEKYILEIKLFDLNRGDGMTRYLKLDKSGMNGKYGFLILNRNQGLIFKNYIPKDEEFRLMTERNNLPYLFVDYFKIDFPVARPPYTEDREPVYKFKADSVFQIPLSNGESSWIQLEKEGIYHFRKDTVSREGITIFRFHEGYPEMVSANELRYPLRYITTRKEFDTLMFHENAKAAIDDFWLKTARSPERAKVLIQKYYSLVEEANRYFTSYMEGWKTDRGLIYVIFGEPDYVYRATDTEEWIYGEPENRNSLRFTFVRVTNPFTDNDFMLLRTPTLKDAWFVTVQSWRR